MKICTKCDETKSLALFSLNGKANDGRHAWCKVCFATYERERYQNGDRVRKERNRDAIISKNKDHLWEVLTSSSCMDCGTKDPLVLEFDHRDPREKSYTVTDMFNLSWNTISREIAKCDIVCCNCHRRRTIKMFGWWRGQR